MRHCRAERTFAASSPHVEVDPLMSIGRFREHRHVFGGNCVPARKTQIASYGVRHSLKAGQACHGPPPPAAASDVE
jgi:hypothetical protein